MADTIHDVILLTGHSPSSPGSRNPGPTMLPRDDTYEYHFNYAIADQVGKRLTRADSGLTCRTEVYAGGDNPFRRWQDRSRLLVELHCGSASGKPEGPRSGTEVLYRATDGTAKKAAQLMQGILVAELGLPDLGVRAVDADARGAHIIHGVNQVALLPQPFFIDNDDDFAVAQETDFVALYVKAINAVLANLQ